MSSDKIYITIGIDVGGTNTDVAIRQQSATNGSSLDVIAWAKQPTTRDVKSGIVDATKKALKQVYEKYKTKQVWISKVGIGTTHFVNAIEQRSGELSPVCVIRLCGPVSKAFSPFIDIPNDLRRMIEGCSYLVDGGFDYNGKEISDMDSKENEAQFLQIAKDIKSKFIKSVAIIGVFSPMNNEQEIKMKNILIEKLGKNYSDDVSFTLSHEISGLGLLPRENASILNASISKMAHRTIKSFQRAMSLIGITAPLFLSKNDGSQCNSKEALKLPIVLCNSGPTNSMKGAALLCNEELFSKTVLIVDIGGTTTEAGLLINGFPQLTATQCKMGGIQVNFSQPNVRSIALGGGTIIDFDGDNKENPVNSVGPKSVGYQLHKSMCFPNGDTLTLTDCAVYNQSLSADALSKTYSQSVDSSKLQGLENVINISTEIMLNKLRSFIDNVRGDSNDLQLILCGGGAKLIPSDFTCAGISNIQCPEYAEVANAIGAASSDISATIDTVVKFEGEDREKVIEQLENQAIYLALNAGAQRGTIRIATKQSIPVQYMPGEMERVIIKACGPADAMQMIQNATKWNPSCIDFENVSDKYTFTVSDEQKLNNNNNINEQNDDGKENVLNEEYKRNLNDDGTIWTLSETDIDYLAVGCAVIGTGGGGSTRPFDVLCKKLLSEGNQVRIVKAKVVDSEDINVICVLFMGAPAMIYEKLFNGNELMGVIEQMRDYLKIKEKNEKTVLMCGEIGGCNGLSPIIAAAQTGFDLVDADFMGRAFPMLQMILPSFEGVSVAPLVFQDEHGTKGILELKDVESNIDAENKMRLKAVELGMKMAVSMCPLKGNQLDRLSIPNSYEFAWTIGKIINDAKANNVNPLLQLLRSDNRLLRGSKIVYCGTIVDLVRKTEGAFNKGTVKLQKVSTYGDRTRHIEDPHIYIEIQNENLVIKDSKEQILVTVPDLIVMFDEECRAVATEELRFGLQVTVMILPAHPLMKTEQALKVVGPRAFGYKTDYTPIEQFVI